MEGVLTEDRGGPVRQTQAVLLAGGKGTRMIPLSLRRPKPMIPFAGAYRLIDFTLSNCLNSGIPRIVVVGQHGLGDLDEHVLRWKRSAPGASVQLLPIAGQRPRSRSTGTADALRLYLRELREAGKELILVLSGDHVYRMDYNAILAFHLERGAEATLAATEVPLLAAGAFGVLETDRSGWVTSFVEKPEWPRALSDTPGRALVSMGVYVFEARTLFDAVSDDAGDSESAHDLGKNILPKLAAGGRLLAFPFRGSHGSGSGYWRDVGTIDSYFAAQMDMLDTRNDSLLGEESWPLGPRRVDTGHDLERHLRLDGSIVSPDCRLRSRDVARSVLSPGVCVDQNARVSDSVLLPGVRVGTGARVCRAIIEEGLVVGRGAVIDGGIVSSPFDERLQSCAAAVRGWARGGRPAQRARRPRRFDPAGSGIPTKGAQSESVALPR